MRMLCAFCYALRFAHHVQSELRTMRTHKNTQRHAHKTQIGARCLLLCALTRGNVGERNVRL